MKEQIEEMQNELCINCKQLMRCSNGVKSNCRLMKVVNILYNAGYRKQKEGEWIAKDNFNGRCSIATCSNCGTEKAFSVLVSIETIASLYPYCQKCGAHMKGGAE